VPVATLADIDLGALQQRMSELSEDVAQQDPKTLRQAVRDRDREIATLKARLAATTPPPPTVTGGTLTDADRAELTDWSSTLRKWSDDLRAGIERIQAISIDLTRRFQAAPSKMSGSGSIPIGTTDKRSGTERILAVLWRASIEGCPLTTVELSIASRMFADRQTFRIYLGTLRHQGRVDVTGTTVSLTTVGAETLPDSLKVPEPAGADLIAAWEVMLPETPRAVFSALVRVYPDEATEPDLAQACGVSLAVLRSALTALRQTGLVPWDALSVRSILFW
jgi:hypothetical protein